MGKILIIDDSIDIVTSIVDMLDETGHQSYFAYTAVEGIKLTRELIPDLILCDILMPQVDGFEFFKKIKSDPVTHHIPVIFMSASAGKMDIKKELELGSYRYIVKPFDIMELQKTIDQIINLAKSNDKNIDN